jgi:hypothetical protein
MPLKWSNAFSYGHCYLTYAPTNSAASPERLKIDPTLFSYGHCYSTYGPTNSAASPEWLKNDPVTPPMATATLLTALLTLLLPLNAWQTIKLILLWPPLLYLWPYSLCCFAWMPYKWSNSLSYGHCYSTHSPTNSAASHQCLTKIRFLPLRPLLLYLRPYQLCCFHWMPDKWYISFAYGQYYSTCDPTKLFYCCLLYSVKLPNMCCLNEYVWIQYCICLSCNFSLVFQHLYHW